MPADDPTLTPQERDLLAEVAELVAVMEQTPDTVVTAAKALHDWVGIDAHLAELVAEPVLTRSDGVTLTFAAGALRVRAEVEPAGYRRRRLVLVAHDEAGGASPPRITIQFPDGSARELMPGRFGECLTEVPAGTLRAVATFGAVDVTTPWFVV
ncbi:MAG: hypothetical protein V9G19_18670 [Tetrasphaera sp.]